jgi:hypothetical protein
MECRARAWHDRGSASKGNEDLRNHDDPPDEIQRALAAGKLRLLQMDLKELLQLIERLRMDIRNLCCLLKRFPDGYQGVWLSVGVLAGGNHGVMVLIEAFTGGHQGVVHSQLSKEARNFEGESISQ